MPRHTLLIDADDTLWENNIFFERTIEQFLSLLEPLDFSREYVRRVLNDTERRNIGQNGYGVHSFSVSLEETYRNLAGQLAQPETLARIGELVRELEAAPPKILDGVPETLAYLKARHRLILLTKGEPAEQSGKVERSGLGSLFEAVEIVSEKDVDVYRSVVGRYRVVKSRGWMIGNSPRSDINPALAAGLNAVFIPHRATWELEHAEVDSGPGRLLILPAFRELRNHF